MGGFGVELRGGVEREYVIDSEYVIMMSDAAI